MSRRAVVTALISFAVLALVTVGVMALWSASGGGPMNGHGMAALVICFAGIGGLTWALMRLAFHSADKGFDDRP